MKELLLYVQMLGLVMTFLGSVLLALPLMPKKQLKSFLKLCGVSLSKRTDAYFGVEQVLQPRPSTRARWVILVISGVFDLLALYMVVWEAFLRVDEGYWRAIATGHPSLATSTSQSLGVLQLVISSFVGARLAAYYGLKGSSFSVIRVGKSLRAHTIWKPGLAMVTIGFLASAFAVLGTSKWG